MAEPNLVVLPAPAVKRALPSHEEIVSHLTRTEKRTPLVDAVGRWVLWIVAFILPLSFLPNLVSEFVLPKVLLLRLLLAVLAVLLVLRWLSQGVISWRRTPLDLPLLASVGSAALSTVFAVNRNVAIFGTYDRWEGLLTIASYALLFFLAVQFLSRPSDARGLSWSLLFCGYIVAGVAILQSRYGLLGGGLGNSAGQVRAEVTLAQPDFTGIFLGMLLPVAVAKVFSRRSLSTRLVAASIALVVALGLVVTYTRAAWIGAFIGCVVVLAMRRGRFHPLPVVGGVTIAAAVLGLSILFAGHQQTTSGGFANAVVNRIASITDPTSPAIASRLRIWHDTPALIASRPILGWGPDTFGLVNAQFQSGPRGGEFFDKPHMEILGVAAYQGLVGVAAYLWILITCVRAFWRGRRLPGAVALFGGFVAYVLALQADFSWIPASVPFWLLLPAAITIWSPTTPTRVGGFPMRGAVPAAAATTAVALLLLIPGVIRPYLADADYYASLNASSLQAARTAIAQARQLAPNEADYAIEAGNYALNLDQNGVPAANANWAGAREAYDTAARLGSFSPEMFQTLAIVDQHLGDHAAALVAARHALALDRYDSNSQRLVAELQTKGG